MAVVVVGSGGRLLSPLSSSWTIFLAFRLPVFLLLLGNAEAKREEDGGGQDCARSRGLAIGCGGLLDREEEEKEGEEEIVDIGKARAVEKEDSAVRLRSSSKDCFCCWFSVVVEVAPSSVSGDKPLDESRFI